MKIFRYLNVVAVAALMGSAVYAYSISYETMLFSAQIATTTDAIQHARDDVGMLRAEWAHLTMPERVQTLADRYLDLQTLQINQIVGIEDLPDRAPKVDEIGRKLATLGLSEPTSTPHQISKGGAATPKR